MRHRIKQTFLSTTFSLIFLIPISCIQPTAPSGKTVDFKNGQVVMVQMKDGSEKMAVVTSSKHNSIYFVREYGSTRRSGKVKRKYIRALSDSEKQLVSQNKK